MKPTKLVPLSFNEALVRQNNLLEGEPLYTGEEVSNHISKYSEEVSRLRKHAQRWQAAFSLTAVLAIWLIAMRFV
ncbi:hypothetical protein ACSFBI_05310 [Variovorax sp. RB3P1]|uniref:hypothetical protein n=1 Tax=Variovorax sp. RB3P1 TaxID=3443732 RepID=UPI003F484FBF